MGSEGALLSVARSPRVQTCHMIIIGEENTDALSGYIVFIGGYYTDNWNAENFNFTPFSPFLTENYQDGRVNG